MSMIRILKLGDVIYENLPVKSYVATNFDENGNPTEYKEIWNVPTDVEELKKAVKDTVLWLAGQKVAKKLEPLGYLSLADVKIYAEMGSEEAKELLKWYLSFDNKMWSWIENELPQKSFEELIELDLYELVESFDD